MDPFFIIIMLAIAALVAFFKMGASNGSAAKRTLSAGPKKTSNTFFRIPDQFTTLEQITEGLRTAGLEACQLIMAVDFTKSNVSQGRRTFSGKSLHDINSDRSKPNPYEKAIFIIGRTLSKFDDDQLIPAYGFGDLQTKGTKCFPFNFDSKPCQGFESVLERYREITRDVCLSGPTNFGPVIREAIEIVKETREYHVLIILADGQVTMKQDTEDAIVAASNYPLSIVIVGVGDGPWDEMECYDDELPARKVDNVQFVDSARFLDFNHGFTSIDEKNEAQFAIAALQELPDHYKTCVKLKML